MNKTTLRLKLRQDRKNLSQTQQTKAASQLANQLFKQPIFKSAQHIAIYYPIAGEMSLLPVKEYTPYTEQTYYLPVLASPKRNKKLNFIQWHNKTKFHPNIYNIPEPIFKKKYCISPKQLDLVIMPLVAFDLKFNRLGMGGGYYDRTFAFTTRIAMESSQPQKPFLLGCGYECQQVLQLKPETWDIPLSAIITEKQIYS